MSEAVLDVLAALAREIVDLDARVGAGVLPLLQAAWAEDGERSPYVGAVAQIGMGVWLTCVCGEDTTEEMFEVRDEVWAEAYDDEVPARNPCVSCFEDALGRDLTPEDFTDNEIHLEATSPRLRDRLGLPGSPGSSAVPSTGEPGLG